MTRERILQHLRTNEDLIFQTKLKFDDELITEIDNLDLNNQKWAISGYRPARQDNFFNGRIKILPCYDADTGIWKFKFTEVIFRYLLDAFKEIDPAYVLKKVIRCNLNYSVNDGSMSDANVHHDSPDINHWSFLVYLKGNTGNTDFVNSLSYSQIIKTIQYEKGKLIIFPSVFSHQGHLPVDHFPRLTLNYILELESSLTEQILIKSPEIIKKFYKEGPHE